ncbi:MAG: 50S ribosomal protein L17 [Ignavibacterium sp.]|nr:50S ribosomal protein L17 [Ignavibacterium sp.]
MRHRKNKKILDRNRDQRRALFKNLALSLVKAEKMKTTLAKAKFLRPKIEKLVTLAKKNNLTARRRLIAIFQNEKIAKKMLEEVAPRYLERNGGYTRIVKAGSRVNDGAEMAYIEFV